MILALLSLGTLPTRSFRTLAAAAPGPSAASGESIAAAGSATAPAAPGEVEPDDVRLRMLRRDIQTLKDSVKSLSGQEQGVLGELKSLESDTLRRQEELAQAEQRLSEAEQREAVLRTSATDLESRVVAMRGIVARRLGALYRLGRPRYARVLLASREPANFLSAYRAAAALSSRDALLIAQYRRTVSDAQKERSRLAALRPELDRQRAETLGLAREASLALERKRTLLRAIQTDRRQNQATLAELEGAQRSAGHMLSDLGSAATGEIGFDRFHGLLDWPAAGRVSARFGQTIDPRFGTTLGHSGLDIEASFGDAIRSIFDGQVIFAQWLRGYGLTVIVDHGGGWLSVYAHASVLLVQKGETIPRGRKIALVGDTGSIRGPFLYFEIRKDGRPVDPLGWLRPRERGI